MFYKYLLLLTEACSLSKNGCFLEYLTDALIPYKVLKVKETFNKILFCLFYIAESGYVQSFLNQMQPTNEGKKQDMGNVLFYPIEHSSKVSRLLQKTKLL